MAVLALLWRLAALGSAPVILNPAQGHRELLCPLRLTGMLVSVKRLEIDWNPYQQVARGCSDGEFPIESLYSHTPRGRHRQKPANCSQHPSHPLHPHAQAHYFRSH
eukprot:756363-Amphidinium_carterae.1